LTTSYKTSKTADPNGAEEKLRCACGWQMERGYRPTVSCGRPARLLLLEATDSRARCASPSSLTRRRSRTGRGRRFAVSKGAGPIWSCSHPI